MNKRSAMLMAAGLVVTMIVAGVAISAGLTGPAASAAAPRATHHRAHKPIVKTIRTTRTVHKKAPSGSAGSAATSYVRMAPFTTTVSSPSSSSFSYEDGHSEDHGYGGGQGGYSDEGGDD